MNAINQALLNLMAAAEQTLATALEAAENGIDRAELPAIQVKCDNVRSMAARVESIAIESVHRVEQELEAARQVGVA